MAQLSDDCFAHGGAPMTVEEAARLVAERLSVVAGIETLPLGLCDGRVAAEGVRALNDLPLFANSAVDGYAVRHADLSPGGQTLLPVSGRLTAGASGQPSATGAAVRIFTGAPMPPEADTVFMQEDVAREGERVALPPGLARGANARPAGEDIQRGGLTIPAGRRLRPQDLALASATGHAALPVRRRLRVALFSTGDELAEPGARLPPGGIYDANRVMLAALLTRMGAQVADLGILRDDPAVLAGRLTEAAGAHDLILTSGGVSVGEADFVRPAVEAAGRLMFWRIAIKPGRPVAMGIVAGTPFVGLPGNPVAVYVTLLFVVRPLVARLAGALYDPPVPQAARAAFAYAKKAGRREFIRVSVRRGEDGALWASRFPREGAGILTALTEGDGLAEIAEATTAVREGDAIAFYPHALLC